MRSAATSLIARDTLFGIGPLARDQNGWATTEMTIGPWCRDPDGQLTYASLGVLIDRLIGAARSGAIPKGCWPSTTELAATFVARLPSEGAPLRASSRPTLTDRRGGVAQARIWRDDNVPVAFAAGRVLLTKLAEHGHRSLQLLEHEPTRSSMFGVLGSSVVRHDDILVVEQPSNTIAANPTGNLHGGVALSLAIAAGALAASSEQHPLAATGARISFIRPCAMVGAVRFVPELVHCGRHAALAHVRCYRADQKLASMASVSLGVPLQG